MNFTEIKHAIREKVTLAEVVRQTVSLKKAGGRNIGLCPFHEEKTPSFTVFDDRYFCFGCKASGDVIDFVRKSNGSNFIEAVHFLGAKYGVNTDSLRQGKKRSAPRKLMYEAMSKARAFFHASLNSPAGQQARAYLQQRGVSAAEIARSKIGYALPTGAALKEHLQQEKVALTTAVDASLLNDKRGDFFRHRIMFPIHDGSGHVIGFGGRALAANSKVKYLNSRENELFHKARVLFGLWHASQAIAAQKTAIVVEGYFDWLALQRAGFKHCVACMGTAFTAAQLRLLQRHVEQVILLFDGDGAGLKAAQHAVPLAFAFPALRIKIAALRGGHDPDSWLQEEGREVLQVLLTDAEDVIEFTTISKLRGQATHNYPQILRNDILPLLQQVNDTLVRGALIAKIEEYSGISRTSIEQALRKTPSPKPAATANKSPPTKVPMWLREFVGHLYYAEPQALAVAELQQFVQQELELTPAWLELVQELLNNLQQGKRNCEVDLSAAAEQTGIIKETLTSLCKNANLYNTNHAQALAVLQLVHQREKIKEKIALLKRDLRRADEPHRRQLLPAIVALQKQRRAIGATVHDRNQL